MQIDTFWTNYQALGSTECSRIQTHVNSAFESCQVHCVLKYLLWKLFVFECFVENNNTIIGFLKVCFICVWLIWDDKQKIIVYLVYYSVKPDWAIFKTFWQQISFQKKPQKLATFCAILQNDTFWDKTEWAIFGKNWAYFYSSIGSHCASRFQFFLLYFNQIPNLQTYLVVKVA